MGSFYLPTLVILYTYASIIYVVQTRNKEFKKVLRLLHYYFEVNLLLPLAIGGNLERGS